MTRKTNSETQLEATPAHPSLSGRLSWISRSAKVDYSQSPHKLVMTAVAVGIVALQVADRLRVSVVLVPMSAVYIFQQTYSPLIAALAAAFVFGIWCAAVAGITAEGLQLYPRAVEKFKIVFPSIVDFFSDSLPGADQSRVEKNRSLKQLGVHLLTRVRRGYTVAGIGTVAYVSTAAVKGESRKAIHLLNVNASLDGGLAVGVVVFAVADAVVRIGQQNPALALQIQEGASNIYLWYGVAIAMIIGQYVASRMKKHAIKNM